MKCVFLGVFSVWISIWIRRKLAVPLIYWILWVSSCCGCEWRKNHVNKFRLNCIIIIHHNLSARMPIAIVACHSTQRMSNRQRTRFEISGYFSHSLNSIRTNVEMNKLSHNILWEYSTRISYTNCWVCWHELRFKYEMNEKKKYKLIRIWRPHTQQDDEQKLQIGILIIPDDWWWQKKTLLIRSIPPTQCIRGMNETILCSRQIVYTNHKFKNTHIRDSPVHNALLSFRYSAHGVLWHLWPFCDSHTIWHINGVWSVKKHIRASHSSQHEIQKKDEDRAAKYSIVDVARAERKKTSIHLKV